MTTQTRTTPSREGTKPFALIHASFRTLDRRRGVTLESPDTSLLGDLPNTRMRIKCGASLYRAGERFGSLYAIRSGFFKTRAHDEDGREQVIGFHMLGDVLGMDGIGTEIHCVDAIALEDSEVLVIPYRDIWHAKLPAKLNQVMSRELVRDCAVLTLLGKPTAECRVASFLVGLSQRFLARGLSPAEFHLRMTRRDIGSYLGLSLETVSRAFSHLTERGLILVDQKHVRVQDMPGLRAIAESELH